jgi:DNA-binding transcriptional LysR family regulator
MPTPRQLEVFVTVADAGSLSAAADALDITQPSVSKQLKVLEQALGGALFVRDRGTRARLSPLGLAMLDDARRTVSLHQRIAGRAVADVPQFFVRDFMLHSLKPRLEQFHAAGLPRATKFVLVDDAEDIAARVGETPGSLALLRNASIPSDRRVTVKFLREYPCSVYADAATARRLAAGELALADLRAILPDGQSSVLGWILRALAEAGIDTADARTGSQFMDMLAGQVAEGAGVAPFMDEHVAGMVAEGRVAPIARCRTPTVLLLLANRRCDAATVECCARIFADF